MVVEAGQLDFSVGLVGESPFRVELAQVNWSFAGERSPEQLSERGHEDLLGGLVAVEVLLEVAGQVSV